MGFNYPTFTLGSFNPQDLENTPIMSGFANHPILTAVGSDTQGDEIMAEESKSDEKGSDIRVEKIFTPPPPVEEIMDTKEEEPITGKQEAKNIEPPETPPTSDVIREIVKVLHQTGRTVGSDVDLTTSDHSDADESSDNAELEEILARDNPEDGKVGENVKQDPKTD
jgi:hypothetical protein